MRVLTFSREHVPQRSTGIDDLPLYQERIPVVALDPDPFLVAVIFVLLQVKIEIPECFDEERTRVCTSFDMVTVAALTQGRESTLPGRLRAKPICQHTVTFVHHGGLQLPGYPQGECGVVVATRA
jgi:hypothetical protein